MLLNIPLKLQLKVHPVLKNSYIQRPFYQNDKINKIKWKAYKNMMKMHKKIDGRNVDSRREGEKNAIEYNKIEI